MPRNSHQLKRSRKVVEHLRRLHRLRGKLQDREIQVRAVKKSVIVAVPKHEPVKYMWAVFQRRPITSLSWWRRWLVRRVYWLVDWQTADGEEKQAICSSEATAKAMVAAGGPNWFYHRLPVDATLPADTCRLDGVRFPLSDASRLYEAHGKKPVPVVCPHTGEACRPYDSISRKDLMRVTKELDKLNTIQAR
jgi:hypothetical protein